MLLKAGTITVYKKPKIWTLYTNLIHFCDSFYVDFVRFSVTLENQRLLPNKRHLRGMTRRDYHETSISSFFV